MKMATITSDLRKSFDTMVIERGWFTVGWPDQWEGRGTGGDWKLKGEFQMTPTRIRCTSFSVQLAGRSDVLESQGPWISTALLRRMPSPRELGVAWAQTRLARIRRLIQQGAVDPERAAWLGGIIGSVAHASKPPTARRYDHALAIYDAAPAGKKTLAVSEALGVSYSNAGVIVNRARKRRVASVQGSE